MGLFFLADGDFPGLSSVPLIGSSLQIYLNLFWSPERIQVNLEMIPNVKKLREGEQTKFAYEVLYLDKAPDIR